VNEQPQASPLNRQDWADAMGRRWLDHLPQFESMLAPIGAAAIEAARLKPGERVVDVGCGGGATTLDIASRLGPKGLAVGIDLSPVLVEAAKAKLAQAEARPGAAPVKFVCGNAATLALEDAPFDVLFSRFGVMFFDDLHAAFRHMRGWLTPTGRVAFVCWAPPKENPWILEIEAINRRYAATPDVDPNAPGPFALSNPDRLRDVLGEAGFVNVTLDAWRGGQAIGGPGATPEQAAQFAMTGMSVGQALKDQPDSVKAKARADVVALFAKHHTKDGVLMPSCAWVVTGKIAS
jgi:SAM-dependent methyltransferase